MARNRRRSGEHEQQEELLPDFSARGYDDLESITRDLPGQEREEASDTPEQALEKLQADRDAAEEAEENATLVGRMKKRRKGAPAPAEEKRERKEVPGGLRRVLLVAITVVIMLLLGVMVLYRVMPGAPDMLSQPESLVARIVTPIQSAFSSVTESIAGYMRTLKLRANLEAEYNSLRAENEQLVYQAMRADELEHQLAQFENIQDEMSANENMNPIACTVIGRDDGNYFSTFTISETPQRGIYSSEDIYSIACRLLEKKYNNSGVRLLGLSLGNLYEGENPEQGEFFMEKEKKLRELEKTILNLSKDGKKVTRATVLKKQ